MASSKDSKTSKTAHVMNLLSRNRGGSEPAAEAPAPAVQEPAPQAQEAASAPETVKAPAPPILTSLKADAEVSSQIKDALEAELEEVQAKTPEPPAHTEPEKAAGPATAAEPVLVPEETPAKAPAAEPALAAEPVPATEPAPAAVQEEAVEAPLDDNISYVNVIQVLVEEKAEKYMEMFGICHCSKCRADVKAYALNHLSPKYVVMGQHEMIPKLTFYEMQNNSDITAQIIKACKIVMNTPHHDR